MQTLERRLHHLERRKGREAIVQVPIRCQSVKGMDSDQFILHFRFKRLEST
jgi:hypothetical protein